MFALRLDDLRLVLRIGLDLRFGEGQRAEVFLGECACLVLCIFRCGVAGQGECQHALGLEAVAIEGNDLQVLVSPSLLITQTPPSD